MKIWKMNKYIIVTPGGIHNNHIHSMAANSICPQQTLNLCRGMNYYAHPRSINNDQ
jgi:hypothetical protein